jgi:hypothetical protein
MASDKFPINNDIDYLHTITSNDAVLDLSTLDWYGIHWFYRTKQGNKVDIAKYTINATTGYTLNLALVVAAEGTVTSHIQRADMAIPVGVKVYWQVYTKDADALHDTDFHGAGCEVEAGVSCDADAL